MISSKYLFTYFLWLSSASFVIYFLDNKTVKALSSLVFSFFKQASFFSTKSFVGGFWARFPKRVCMAYLCPIERLSHLLKSTSFSSPCVFYYLIYSFSRIFTRDLILDFSRIVDLLPDISSKLGKIKLAVCLASDKRSLLGLTISIFICSTNFLYYYTCRCRDRLACSSWPIISCCCWCIFLADFLSPDVSSVGLLDS